MKTMIFQRLKLFFFIILCLHLFSCDKEDKEDIKEPDIEIPLEEKMMLIITTTTDGASIKLPFTGTVNCQIAWDGNNLEPETVTEAYPTHTYSKKGDYLILISGTVTEINANGLDESELACISGIYNFGKIGLTNLYSAFKGCTNLTYLSNYNSSSLADVTSFEDAFSECPLTIIPSDLFTDCRSVISFKNTFHNCINLTEIPSGLFGNCSSVISFAGTFNNCVNLKEIPSGLFNNCTQVESFKNTFNGCTGLTEIPPGLFDNCSSVMTFASTFHNCVNLKEIPSGLFNNCTQASDFMSTFQNCKNLTEIPFGLFDNCKEIENLMVTFAGCKNLTGESPYTIIENNKVHLYERNDKTGEFIKPKYFYSCFSECVGLSDFSDLPNEWK